MSPFCRECLGVAPEEGESRCPLDQTFYLRRNCPACAREVFPRELHCAHCRAPLAGAPETLLLPPAARAWPTLAAFGLDLLGVCLVVGSMLWSLGTIWSLLFGVSIGVLYRAIARAGGRQSFGQAVFHLLTVNQEAGPASPGQSLRRTLGEALWLPWACFDGAAALGKLDQFSDSYEVRLD